MTPRSMRRRRFIAALTALPAVTASPALIAASGLRALFATRASTATATMRAASAVTALTAVQAVSAQAASPSPAVAAASRDAAVVKGRVLRFPDDEGSHPTFRIEWWYVTGWLKDEAKRDLGFQLTFFRTRVIETKGNPSRFASEHLLVAHAAVSDPRRGHLVHAQQLARAGFGLAEAHAAKTDVRIGKWSLRADGGKRLHAIAIDRALQMDLTLERTQPPLLQGDAGFSRKGPSPASASYYYTLPHLAVTGNLAAGGTAPQRVNGVAWLDHEWSSAPMEANAAGWDWIGINLDDGGALMAFRMRDKQGGALWSSATHRLNDGTVEAYPPARVRWTPTRRWQSKRTTATYPVSWRVEIGELAVDIEPLMDDQEQDARSSTGAVYWEGAVTATRGGRIIGRGYLELTGYWRPLRI